MLSAQDIQDKLKDWGASFVGFSDVGGKLPPDLRSLRYAITVGVRLSNFIVDGITDRPTYTYFHHYRAVNALIDQITLRGMLLLQDWGYSGVAVPASQTVRDAAESYSGIFPHKTAAVKAGLGWIGKSGLFISSEFGPRVRLGTILTDFKLPVEAVETAGGCGECRLCVESCPAAALTGSPWREGCRRSEIVDAKACSDYMNEKFKHIGRGAVCGICMKVCPYGAR
ncbi:MAG: 4Fe-4S double cluster binding domain-containing protein [Clostridiales bacterium]|nr:epoxyqueuosine reductase [Eubacteriales bacterium]MDH7565892.1 4Fe-4S double cluster binding domain-containing protein [Clostridiales bacterium]